MAPLLLLSLPLRLRPIPAAAESSTSQITPRPRSPRPFPWRRLLLRLPALQAQVQCLAAPAGGPDAPAPTPRWHAALSAAAGLYPAGLRRGRRVRGRRADRGVPVVRGAGAGVLHRHARLHHSRHGLHQSLSAGLILLGCCPGGTASNVVILVAQGDVPLSIVMTVCSTLAAVFLTPLLTKILAGAYIPVDAVKLSLSTLQVVVAPILLGSSIQTAFPSVVQFVTPFAPLMAVLASSLLACSYAAAAIGGFKEKQRRAISIEVGMQNSSLGVVLATAHFSSPLVALPPALSAVIMNMMGSTLGLIWQSINPSVSENETTDITNA